jgi:thiamine biosynthesis lipoprotein
MATTATRWSALGTYVFLATADPGVLDDARAIAQEVLWAVDRTCSRFRHDSDLVRANAAPGSWVPVDPLLVAAVRVAVEASQETGGLVDPCLGRSMVWLGYDADLAAVRRRADPPRSTPPPSPRPGAWREIGLDPEGAVRVPPGCSLDLGATAKAWASDLVAAAVVERLDCQVIVSLGGDIRVDGPGGAAHAAWPVMVAERPEDELTELVWLQGGGLATSTTTVRRWSSAGVERHHLLDPRTGLPTTGPWRTVTATGPTCVSANTATTAALVLGEEAVGWLSERSVTARLVADDGTVALTGCWPEDPVRTPAGTSTDDGRF